MADRDAEDEQKRHPKRVADKTAKRPVHAKKDYDRLVKAAWRNGWWCERKKTNYIYCYPPGDEGVVVLKSTPRKQGTLNLATEKMRKFGLDV